MKTSLLSLALAGAFSLTTLHAQTAAPAAPPPAPAGAPGGPGEKGKGKHFEKMKDELSLTDDQVAKIQGIFKEQKPAMESIKKDPSLTPEQKKEKMTELRKAADEKISAVLTPEQKAKWEAAKKSRKDKKQAGGAPAAN